MGVGRDQIRDAGVRRTSGARGRAGSIGARTGARLVARAALITTIAALLVLTALSAPAANAQNTPTGRDAVDVRVEVGIAGVVPNISRVPVRVTLTSERSRTVVLSLSNGPSDMRQRVELSAGATTPVDVVMQLPVTEINAVVTGPDGARVGAGRGTGEIDGTTEVVGIGASIAGHREPWKSDTVAGIQTATLVPVNVDLLARPGVLDTLAGLVLAPADVERFSPDLRRQVSAWVGRGGNLALDQARVDRLPVLDIDAEPGDRTAVEAGWVRFTGGKAATGAWTEVVEPAPAYSDALGPVSSAGMFDPTGSGSNVFDSVVRSLGLITVEYLPSWVIVVAVLLSSVLIGPVMWMGLRTRRRRGWMWLLAPGLAVAIAGALLAVGQGSLSNASGEAIGAITSTKWMSSGEFAVGTTQDDRPVQLGETGQIWASSPRVTSESGATSVRQKVGTNGFGAMGIGVVPVADDAVISVRAVPAAGTRVTVSVTNHTKGKLTGVVISGFTRTRKFSDVGPGATESLEFETGSEQSAFGTLFPVDPNAVQQAQFCGPNFCTGGGNTTAIGRVPFLPLAQRGRVVITGSLRTSLPVGGTVRQVSATVSAVAPVTVAGAKGSESDASATAAVRIESVGEPSAWRDAVVGMFGVKGGIDMSTVGQGGLSFGGPVDAGPVSVPDPVVPPDAANAPTTTALAVPIAPAPTIDPSLPPGASFEAAMNPTLPERTNFAVLSSPVAQPALRCAVHTVVNTIEEWRGGQWVALADGAPRGPDKTFTEPNETRVMQFSPLAAGETRFLRVTSGLNVSVPSTISCRGDA